MVAATFRIKVWNAPVLFFSSSSWVFSLFLYLTGKKKLIDSLGRAFYTGLWCSPNRRRSLVLFIIIAELFLPPPFLSLLSISFQWWIWCCWKRRISCRHPFLSPPSSSRYVEEEKKIIESISEATFNELLAPWFSMARAFFFNAFLMRCSHNNYFIIIPWRYCVLVSITTRRNYRVGRILFLLFTNNRSPRISPPALFLSHLAVLLCAVGVYSSTIILSV